MAADHTPQPGPGGGVTLPPTEGAYAQPSHCPASTAPSYILIAPSSDSPTVRPLHRPHPLHLALPNPRGAKLLGRSPLLGKARLVRRRHL